MTDDARAVRELLQSCEEPTTVVAHSDGGMVASEAAAGLEHVRHLLLITSFLPEAGQSLATFGDGAPAPHFDMGQDGTFGLREDPAVQTFLQDGDDEIAGQARFRLVRRTVAVLSGPVTAAAWKEIPSTYVVCARDRGTPPDVQRVQAGRAGRTIELQADHHPFLSQPAAAVADLIGDLMP